MALLNAYVQVYGQFPKFFETIREGQAPDKFTRQHLKDIGFKSSNHHALIPLLKGLGFLTADGSPTERYKDFMDKSKSKRVLSEAIREAYGDIFTIKAKPTKTDRDLIEGKFKSTYNLSENTAKLSASTFLSLLDLADPEVLYGSPKKGVETAEPKHKEAEVVEKASLSKGEISYDRLGLHYNIQIHLPATKEIEVYNAIFKSLREHLIE